MTDDHRAVFKWAHSWDSNLLGDALAGACAWKAQLGLHMSTLAFVKTMLNPYGGFQCFHSHWGTPKMESPIKMEDLRVPPFMGTSIRR